MSIVEKLVKIQSELKAPKNQRNNFGNYNYRNCEDILEAVKPIANPLGCVVTLTDEIVLIGERYYIKATASLSDSENTLSNTAYAREEETKKGMDSSQITGCASSYARKYALNGLFAIDDTKDPDTDEKKISKEQYAEIEKLVAEKNINIKTICDAYKIKSLVDMQEKDFANCIKRLNASAKQG